MTKYSTTPMRQLMAVTKALADDNRVRILGALRQGELCVCQLIELLGLAPSTVSKHLALLRQAALIEARKDGRWVHYRLAGRRAGRTVQRALRFVLDALQDDGAAEQDASRLARILALDPEVLCSQQRGPSALRRRGARRGVPAGGASP